MPRFWAVVQIHVWLSSLKHAAGMRHSIISRRCDRAGAAEIGRSGGGAVSGACYRMPARTDGMSCDRAGYPVCLVLDQIVEGWSPRMPRQRQAPQFTPEQRDQIQAGLTTLKNGDVEGAREIYINLLEADPELAAGHVGLGRVFAAEGDYVRALEHFEEAVAIQPDFTRAYMMSADAHEQMGEIDAAVADIDAAIRSDPTK